MSPRPQVMPKKNLNSTISTLNVDGVTPVSIMRMHNLPAL